jgi:hypothetical protein
MSSHQPPDPIFIISIAAGLPAPTRRRHDCDHQHPTGIDVTDCRIDPIRASPRDLTQPEKSSATMPKNPAQTADGRDAAAISSVSARLDALQEVVFESTLPTQALHGDVSLCNPLHTSQRLIWNDFGETSPRLVPWDLASYVSSLRIRGASSSFV